MAWVGVRRHLAFSLLVSSLALVSVGTWVGCKGGERRAAASPNVLLIVLDTARLDFFSAYGFPRPTTPNVDALAESGVRFDYAYATANWTVPSHASILTGYYPSAIGSTWSAPRLHESVDSLAETTWIPLPASSSFSVETSNTN